MLTSVIIPVFNRVEYLRECVESVLSQQGAKVEVIVVDDGSGEDVGAALGELRAQVKLLRQPNRGLPAARNTGFCAARGELICFLDSDDRFRPGRIAAHAAAFAAHPEKGVVFSRHAYFPADSAAPAPPPEYCLNEARPERHLLDYCFMAVGAQTVRRELLEAAGGFDESLPAAEDWDMWIRLSWLTSFYFHNATLVDIRLHTDRMSTDIAQMHAAQCEVLRNSFQNIAQAIAAGDYSLGPLDRWTASTYYNLGNAAYRLGELKLARRAFLRAIALQPGRYLFSHAPWALLKSLLGSALLDRARKWRLSSNSVEHR